MIAAGEFHARYTQQFFELGVCRETHSFVGQKDQYGLACCPRRFGYAGYVVQVLIFRDHDAQHFCCHFVHLLSLSKYSARKKAGQMFCPARVRSRTLQGTAKRLLLGASDSLGRPACQLTSS
jgi:hypothetical protein